MPDDLPAMTANEALLQLRAIAKPFKALLDMDRIFTAAIDAERGLVDNAAAKAALDAVLAKLASACDDAKRELTAARAEAVAVLATARASAAAIVAEANEDGKAALARASKNCEALCADATAKADAAKHKSDKHAAAIEAHIARKAAIEKETVEAQTRLDAIRAAIAKLNAG